ncbi:MAG: peptide deformylase [Alphaproteobacteria bacterium]
MAKRLIIPAPDMRLKQKCRPVDGVDADVRQLMADMLETMYDAPGIGLAAPQVGVLRRVIVVDVSNSADGEGPGPLKMANPELLSMSEEQASYDEGCLSLPNQFGVVERPRRIVVRYLDETGAERELAAEGLLATCIQHEMDHLDGVLFVDHLSSLKRGIILRKLTKAKRTGDLPDYAEGHARKVA